MITAMKIDSYTTPEERASELLLNAFGGEVVIQNPNLNRGLAEALRKIAAEERAGA